MENKINWKIVRNGLFLIVVVLFLMPILISSIFSFFPINETLYVYLANSLNYAILLTLLIFIYKEPLKKDGKDFLKNWKTYLPKILFNWIRALVFMIFTNLILISFLGNIAENEAQNETLLQNYPIFSVFLMVVIGPFIEELLFRLGFKNAFKNKNVYLFFTAILFGFGHILASFDFSTLEGFLACLPQCLFIIPYSGIGYFLAKTYMDTDNIFSSVTFHSIHNGLAVVISLIGMMLS